MSISLFNVQQLISFYEILSSTNVSANETSKMISFDVCVDLSSKFSIFLSFSSHFLTFFLAYWLRLEVSNSIRKFCWFFFWFLRSIFIQSSEFSRSNNNSFWTDVFCHIRKIDSRFCCSRIFDSRIFLILFDQSSSHSKIFLAML
jgi:hypothetical protein